MSAERSPSPPLTLPDSAQKPRLWPGLDSISQWPWWLLLAIALGLLIVFRIATNEQWQAILRFVVTGIRVTLTVAFVGYATAVLVGLIVGLGRVSQGRTWYEVIYYNVATFYVEIVRGVPILVLIMYIAFVGVPLIIEGLKNLGEWLLSVNISFLGTPLSELSTRDVSNTVRATFALGVAYGAFEAEIFRAGIQSIEKGQMEAARSLGMSYFQALRYIILPQAVRRVLPALGNDFVAMVKDSSLVSVLGVRDITQAANLYAASTFLYFQTFNLLAFIYLLLTVMLTRLVRWLERRLATGRR
ncbi:MAG: amino acid ABC transporter permease [Chloroflexi bacterium]|nr:amino acid ABC transporter permease [Chloroflexota bacterium]MCI0578308.1 amino acid ABC transporter permease [Chloroflexota bacterium]MCI0649024.1 amino acid ABC transporter permease [Chloroflexota bacterium]MCI0729459.1 amino acid ABC transporter permease [Chloroflexota bacterium]